ncbi:hypothetical protein COUCH_14575 [Couchioplanes caeruleus]|uniref:hypothetical protein n=1 Tax=Couchioplanes caeruleus TaxID=56438 RepID=UPI0020C1652C|nr:hypothetical protein [Couchioplanes caeruleus]UQU67414.1 hypothetical protein COUCH_14575 [Couchioplanes caeruleus]
MTDPQRPSQTASGPGPRKTSAQIQLEHMQALGYQYDIVSTALRRMLTFNARHAEYAWQRRRRDPIAPYALALLFADHRPGTIRRDQTFSADDWTGAVEVNAASRVWLVGPETHNLAEMLYRLECQVTDQHTIDGWVLREQLATSVDDAITDRATWVGIGVSSLDTPTGAWAETAEHALSEAHVPGTIRLLLNVAHTPIPELAWMVGERRGIGEYNTKTIHSTHRLSSLDINAPVPYGIVHPDNLVANPWHGPILRRMHGLFTALHTSTHFAHPLGRPPKGSQWREALDQPGRRS